MKEYTWFEFLPDYSVSPRDFKMRVSKDNYMYKFYENSRNWRKMDDKKVKR